MAPRTLAVLVAVAACNRPPPAVPIAQAQDGAEQGDGEYVLVTDANFGYPHQGRPNAARLVVDPREVAELRRFLIGNPHPAFHRCGYHWRLVFGGRDRIDGAELVNQECELYTHDTELIRARVRELGAQVVAAPDRFIYTLVVPTTTPQREAVARLRAAHELFFYVPDSDLPWAHVELIGTWPEAPRVLSADEADGDHDRKWAGLADRLRRAITALPATLGAKLVTPVDNNSWTSNDRGTSELVMVADLRLTRGADLAQLRVAVATFGGQVTDAGVPAEYEVSVVVKEPSLARAKAQLLARYPFARDVIEHRGLPDAALPALPARL
jgi:hypothetical protein